MRKLNYSDSQCCVLVKFSDAQETLHWFYYGEKLNGKAVTGATIDSARFRVIFAEHATNKAREDLR